MASEVGVEPPWVLDCTVVGLAIGEAHGLAVEVCEWDGTPLLVEEREGVGIPLLEAMVGLADSVGGCERVK